MYLLAATNYKLGSFERANNLAEKSFSIAPSFIPVRKLLAELYLQQKKEKKPKGL